MDKMEPRVHDMSLETEFVTNLTIVFIRHTAVDIRHSVRKRRTYTAFSRESVTSLSTEATYVENRFGRFSVERNETHIYIHMNTSV